MSQQINSGNAAKDPQTWTTGGEPMTSAQKSYLDSLTDRTSQQAPAELTKAQASQAIEQLQNTTGNTNQTGDSSATGNQQKDPATWTTGGEPMTGAQKSYLHTLSQEAHVPVDDSLNKAEASMRIGELRQHNARVEASDQS